MSSTLLCIVWLQFGGKIDTGVQAVLGHIDARNAQQEQLAKEAARWANVASSSPSCILHHGEALNQAAAPTDMDTADPGSTALAHPGSNPTEQSLDECRAECKQASKAYDKVQAVLRALPRPELTPEQRAALQQRNAQAETAKARLKVLEDAAVVLRGDVRRSKEAALSLNERVFRRAAASFQSTMAAVLPDFEFEAVATGECAADGVTVRYRKRSAEQGGQSQADNADAGYDTWRTALAELSGGQRSLCSVAFILAATTAGIAPSLMLVDEIDAALDDVNQTRVGTMLHHCSEAHNCQVLAVSHSAAFHGWCDTLVKVKRGQHGTEAQVLAQNGTSAQVGANKFGKSAKSGIMSAVLGKKKRKVAA